MGVVLEGGMCPVMLLATSLTLQLMFQSLPASTHKANMQPDHHVVLARPYACMQHG